MKTLDLFQSLSGAETESGAFFFHEDQNAEAFHARLAEIISKLVLQFSSD